MKISLLKRIQLKIVLLTTAFLNFGLNIFKFILFPIKIKNPQNILIYKIGNIGDIICAVPSFIAIRRAYSEAKITLLTSPGDRNAIGAKELLNGAWYFDEMKIYYSDEINSGNKKTEFVKNLKKNNYDLFIQFPDDLADFRTLLRNLFFAKLIGVKSVFGFKIRTIQLFKKTQVDYSFKKTEVDNLLNILEENGIKLGKIEFNFPISESAKNKVRNLLVKSFGPSYKNETIIAVSPAGKRGANKWSVEQYKKLALYLKDKYNAKIAVIGGKSETESAKTIISGLSEKDAVVLAGELSPLETIEFLKQCSFLISNDTGAAHMAAAVSLSVVGIYGIRNVFGSWFPYGKNHKIIYYKFLNCDYRTENCIMKSVKMVEFKEVADACDKILKNLK